MTAKPAVFLKIPFNGNGQQLKTKQIKKTFYALVTFVLVTLKTSLKFVRKLVTCNANQNGSIVLTKRINVSAEYNKLNVYICARATIRPSCLKFPKRVCNFEIMIRALFSLVCLADVRSFLWRLLLWELWFVSGRNLKKKILAG